MVLFSPAYKIFWNLQELTGRKKNLFGRHSPHFNNRIFLTENCHILNFSIYWVAVNTKSTIWQLLSLACHTFCDTGHPFIVVISEDPWHSHLFPSVWMWSCHYLFLRLRSVAAGIRTPNLPLAGPRNTCIVWLQNIIIHNIINNVNNYI